MWYFVSDSLGRNTYKNGSHFVGSSHSSLHSCGFLHLSWCTANLLALAYIEVSPWRNCRTWGPLQIMLPHATSIGKGSRKIHNLARIKQKAQGEEIVSSHHLQNNSLMWLLIVSPFYLLAVWFTVQVYIAPEGDFCVYCLDYNLVLPLLNHKWFGVTCLLCRKSAHCALCREVQLHQTVNWMSQHHLPTPLRMIHFL